MYEQTNKHNCSFNDKQRIIVCNTERSGKRTLTKDNTNLSRNKRAKLIKKSEDKRDEHDASSYYQQFISNYKNLKSWINSIISQVSTINSRGKAAVKALSNRLHVS